jgi:hypothetical protein
VQAPAEQKVSRKRAPAALPEPTTNGEPKRRGRRKRKEKEPVQAEAKSASVQRSAPEPGMENPDVDFIKGLSSRLSAYSIDAEKERERAASAADGEKETV